MADNSLRTPGSGESIASEDISSVKHQLVKVEFGTAGTATKVSPSNPLPVDDADTQTALAAILAVLADPATETTLAAVLTAVDGLEGGIGAANDGAATQGSTGSLSAKLRTVTAQLNTIVGHVDGIETLLTAVDGHVDGLEGKDFATQTTLAAVLAAVDGLEGFTDGIETALSTLNSKDFATQTTLAAILAAVDGLEGFTDGLESAFSTLNGKDFATQTTLAAILAAVDGLEGFTDGLEGQLTTLAGYLDGVEALLGGTGKLGLAPQTSGGLLIAKFLDLDEADQAVKASAGQLFGWYLFNSAASTRYVKLYNATAANVTVGSTTPVLSIPVPAGAAANVEFANGIEFSTAITAACVTGVADNSSGAPGAGEVTAMLFYK